MSDLLLVMNPREIEECVASIRRLPIDQLWIKRMREFDIESCWTEIMAMTEGYDRLFIVGDDVIVRPQALESVQRLLDDGHLVATGWSNFAENDWRANLTSEPLFGDAPATNAYPGLHTTEEVWAWDGDYLPTFLTGYTLLGMGRELWERLPFRVFGGYPGWGSDFSVSKRLDEEGFAPFVAAVDGFCYHVKQVWNQVDTDGRKQLLVGAEPAELVMREAVLA